MKTFTFMTDVRQTTTNGDLVTPSLGLLMLLVVCLGVPAAVYYLVSSPPSAPLYWDIANVFGYVGAGLFLVLFVYSGQRRAFPPFSGRFFIRLHHHLGYAALLVTVLHIGILVERETYMIEHLKIGAPGYMLAGLVAAILVLVITLTSIQSIRRRLWNNYSLFRFIHALLGVAILAFTAWHIVGSSWYANLTWKLAAWLAATGVVVTIYFGGKYRQQVFDVDPRHRGRRPAAIIVYLSIAVLSCVAILLALALQE